jgi:hypothetical protein
MSRYIRKLSKSIALILVLIGGSAVSASAPVVAIPLGSDVSAELCRYFQIRKAWDLRRYASVTEGDLIFRNQAKARFVGERFEYRYRAWKAGRVTEADIRREFGGADRPVTVNFATEILRRIGVPDLESEGRG